MAKPQKRLGKGLSALLGDAPQHKTHKEGDTYQLLALNQISIDAQQPRKYFDSQAIELLAVSIKNFGVLQPILVRKEHDTYRIIAGERRYRACVSLDLSHIPAIITDSSQHSSLEKALIENLHRENLNPIELASAIEHIMSSLNYTQEDIAKKIGMSRPAITNILRLLHLPDIVQDAIKKNILSQSHARTLLSTKNKEDLLYAFEFIKNTQPSITELEEFIKTLHSQKNSSQKKVNNIHREHTKKETTYIEEALYKYLGTRVSISPSFNKGTMQIHYFSKEDLERILERLGIPLL